LWDGNGALTSDHFWAYGEPCGMWRELAGGSEVSHQEFDDCDAVDEPPLPETGPPLAVVGDYGWDGTACAAGTLVSAPPDDPNARFCANGDVKQGPFGRCEAARDQRQRGQERHRLVLQREAQQRPDGSWHAGTRCHAPPWSLAARCSQGTG